MKDELGHGSGPRGEFQRPSNSSVMPSRLERMIRVTSGVVSDTQAARALASGPKSAQVPVHDAQAQITANRAHEQSVNAYWSKAGPWNLMKHLRGE